MPYSVAAFYRFVAIADGAPFKARLLEQCRERGIRGTILIAPEGINATIAGAEAQIASFLALLSQDPRFDGLDVKRSVSENRPFQRLKVKLKREIVTFGVPQANPTERSGTYVDAGAWNDLMADPNVVLIDTRNSYETAIGTFPGALDPGTKSFGEFPEFIARNRNAIANKKIAMFCTGGIRCEKATAYLVGLGFPEVYHLRGGILRYLEIVPESESRWRGECFVFDERTALTHGVSDGSYQMCPSCGRPAQQGADCQSCANI